MPKTQTITIEAMRMENRTAIRVLSFTKPPNRYEPEPPQVYRLVGVAGAVVVTTGGIRPLSM